MEANENSYLSRIAKVQIADHRIFILNSAGAMKRDVLQFSDEGRYLGKLDAQGGGPQEYQSMSDFDIHPVKKQVSVEKTDDTHPGKTAIPVHFFAYSVKAL